jgi:hypothetical protein
MPGKRDEFRMTVDCRYANSQVQPVAGFLPILEVNFQHLENVAWFSSLDAFKGFWQFPLAEESQEVYSFLTELGVLNRFGTSAECEKTFGGAGKRMFSTILKLMWYLFPGSEEVSKFLSARVLRSHNSLEKEQR